MKILLLIVSAIFLSSCRGNMPEAPITIQCIIDLNSGIEICRSYKFDVIGGEVIPDSEIRRPITDRMICYPIDEYLRMTTWRDEFIEWSQDRECK